MLNVNRTLGSYKRKQNTKINIIFHPVTQRFDMKSEFPLMRPYSLTPDHSREKNKNKKQTKTTKTSNPATLSKLISRTHILWPSSFLFHTNFVHKQRIQL